MMVQVDTPGADNRSMKDVRLSLGTVGHHDHRMSGVVHQVTGFSWTESRVGSS